MDERNARGPRVGLPPRNGPERAPLVLEAAVFDLDGTLVDSAGDILHTLRESLAAEGVPCAPEAFRPQLLGPPLEEILDHVCPGLEPALHARVVRRYRAAYRECGFARSPLYPHVREQLELLRAAGLRLFVASYKPCDVSGRLLRHHGIRALFHDTVHSDSEPGRRLTKVEMLARLVRVHGLTPGRSLMQGDGPGDMTAARSCGMFAAAALYGYAPRETLLAAGPDICLPAMDWRTGTLRADGGPFRWKSATGTGSGA